MAATTFDTLPDTVYQIFLKVERLESLMQQKQRVNASIPEEDLMTIEEVCKFLKLSKPTVYNLVSASKIPNSKVGKRLYFSRSKILKWIESGERKTKRQYAESV